MASKGNMLERPGSTATCYYAFCFACSSLFGSRPAALLIFLINKQPCSCDELTETNYGSLLLLIDQPPFTGWRLDEVFGRQQFFLHSVVQPRWVMTCDVKSFIMWVIYTNLLCLLPPEGTRSCFGSFRAVLFCTRQHWARTNEF